MELPPDLTPVEAAIVAAIRRPAEERAALAVRVRREVERLERRGCGREAALDLVSGDRSVGVSRRTAARIVRGEGGWS